jgi:hypothetical protein
MSDDDQSAEVPFICRCCENEGHCNGSPAECEANLARRGATAALDSILGRTP